MTKTQSINGLTPEVIEKIISHWRYELYPNTHLADLRHYLEHKLTKRKQSQEVLDVWVKAAEEWLNTTPQAIKEALHREYNGAPREKFRMQALEHWDIPPPPSSHEIGEY